MLTITISRRTVLISLALLAVLISTAVLTRGLGASSSADAGRQIRNQSFSPRTLQQMIQAHQLAPTVRVLSSQPPSVIVQFPLFPSGVKNAFPKATGVVTIAQGNPAVSLFDSVTVDVSNMPPNITFTIFFIELANKPFGHVEYVADLHTRADGSGEASFQAITFVAFAADNRTPTTSQDQSGEASGIQLEHLGMWFSSLQDAQTVLHDNTLKGTIFDGGSPPLHAGPQAMTDGQTAPVF
ncbi:MAG TPA: hypothetical protein VFA41_21270 [Ktedonobacteraceae bacterium]|jgi:hypothetical protein|nr:hypothetical protein [Ktedonobacteraceae bacterium]